MDFNEYKKLSPEARNNLEKTTTDVEELATLEELKKQFEIEMQNEINAFKNDNGKVDQIVNSVNVENPETVEKVKTEIGLDEKLKGLDKEAEKLLEIENREAEKEKIVKRLEDLFDKVDISELEKSDADKKNSGWMSEERAKTFQEFRRELIEKIKDSNRYLYRIPDFENLISQSAFQEIMSFVAGNFPEAFFNHDSNERLNSLIQERPEFLNSQEIKSLYKYQIIKGIENCDMFEGYRTNAPLVDNSVQKEHVNFFKELEFKWDRDESTERTDDFGRVNRRGLGIDFDDYKGRAAEKVEKKKRIKVPKQDKRLILNIERYKYDAEVLTSLSEEDKSEVKEKFLDILAKNIYSGYGSRVLFADEIYRVGEKLGVGKEEVNKKVLEGFKVMLKRGCYPENNIDSEFADVYQNLQSLLHNPDDRKSLLELIYTTMGLQDISERDFIGYQKMLEYIKATAEEKATFVNRFLDFSRTESFREKGEFVFGHPWETEEQMKFLKEQRLQAFSTMNQEQRASLLIRYGVNSFGNLAYLPFNENDFLEFLSFHESRNNHDYFYSKESLSEFCNTVHESFPTVTIDPKKIYIQEIAKNPRYWWSEKYGVDKIKAYLLQKGYDFTAQDIVNAFPSPEEFVRNQIKGADIGKLKELQEFRDNPETPELPFLSGELFQEIKEAMIRAKDNVWRIKALKEFVPKDYRMALFSTPELQSMFSEEYERLLEKEERELDSLKTLSFLISKTENRDGAEKAVFEKLMEEKDPKKIVPFFLRLKEVHEGSEVVKEVKEFIETNLDQWMKSSGDLWILKGLYNIPDVKHKIDKYVDSELQKITPENPGSDSDLYPWFSIKYEDTHYSSILDRFKKIRHAKNFEFFDELMNKGYKLYEGGKWEELYENMGHFSDNDSKFLIKTFSVERDKDLKYLVQLMEKEGDISVTGKIANVIDNLDPGIKINNIDKWILLVINMPPEKNKKISNLHLSANYSMESLATLSDTLLDELQEVVDNIKSVPPEEIDLSKEIIARIFHSEYPHQTYEHLKRLEQEIKSQNVELSKPLVLAYISRFEKHASSQEKEYFFEGIKKDAKLVSENKPVTFFEYKEYYEYVLKEVYPMRNYNTYSHLDQYEDRTADIDKYVFDRNGYEMHLSGVLGYRVKEGMVSAPEFLNEFSQRINTIKAISDEQALIKFLNSSIENSEAKTLEGKILDYFKQKGYTVDTMNVLLAYQLQGRYDEFFSGSADRVSAEEDQVSKNFVLLDELVNQYGDNMKETIKLIQEKVATGDDRELFAGSSVNKYQKRYEELSQNILSDLNKIPRNKISDQTIQKKILRTIKNTFQSLEHVQKRADYFTSLFTVNDLDSFNETWMRHVNELFILDEKSSIDTGKVESLQSSVYTKLQNEIGKYEEIKEVDTTKNKGKEEEKLSKERTIKAYFSKNKENAHARMVADVCLANDPNMLKNKKYFEFVLFDEEREKCMGTTMLLEMDEPQDGKKYLLYCPNPSVGLVSEISAKKLYKQITDQIIKFSKDNGFDGVLVNKTHGHSTNRAGLFQQSLEQSCLKDRTGKERTIDLKYWHTLGGGYSYKDGLQIVWENNA